MRIDGGVKSIGRPAHELRALTSLLVWKKEWKKKKALVCSLPARNKRALIKRWGWAESTLLIACVTPRSHCNSCRSSHRLTKDTVTQRQRLDRTQLTQEVESLEVSEFGIIFISWAKKKHTHTYWFLGISVFTAQRQKRAIVWQRKGPMKHQHVLIPTHHILTRCHLQNNHSPLRLEHWPQTPVSGAKSYLSDPSASTPPTQW